MSVFEARRMSLSVFWVRRSLSLSVRDNNWLLTSNFIFKRRIPVARERCPLLAPATKNFVLATVRGTIYKWFFQRTALREKNGAVWMASACFAINFDIFVYWEGGGHRFWDDGRQIKISGQYCSSRDLRGYRQEAEGSSTPKVCL